MPRHPRIDFPGAWHHAMNRVSRREPVFLRDAHYRLFLSQLEAAVEATGIEVHGYALMPNHYHLLIRSPRATLSAAMRQLGASFTQQMNWRYGWDGPLFRGRFRSRLVLGEADVANLLAYLHLNPVRAGLVGSAEDFRWTSHRAYLGLTRQPPWLSVGLIRGWFGSKARLREFVDARVPASSEDEGPIDLPAPRGEGPEWTERHVAAPLMPPTPADVLAVVVSLTGATLSSIRSTCRGPRANPARRLAVWALAEHARLTHREIGVELSMSMHQVANVLRRLRQRPTAELLGWQRSVDRVDFDRQPLCDK